MTATKVDTLRTRTLGKLLVRAFDPDMTTSELAALIEDIAKKLWIDLPGADKVMPTLKSLPPNTSVATGLLTLSNGIGLTVEEAVYFVDIVADLILTAIPAAKNLFIAHHQGDEQGVRDQLAILNKRRAKVTETVVFEEGTYTQRRTVPVKLLAPEHGGGQFLHLAPILALLVVEFLVAGGATYLRPCAFCGDLFHSFRSDARACTDSCRAKLSLRERGL